MSTVTTISNDNYNNTLEMSLIGQEGENCRVTMNG